MKLQSENIKEMLQNFPAIMKTFQIIPEDLKTPPKDPGQNRKFFPAFQSPL